MTDCTTCDGTGVIDDPTACTDPDHCDPTNTCPDCEGTGHQA